MFKWMKKDNFPVHLLVAAALSALAILPLFVYFLRSFLPAGPWHAGKDRYYISTSELKQETDPMITRVPRLKDILAGPILSKNDPSIGKQNAPATIVVFSDFKCKYCAAQENVIKRVYERYPDQVRVIWKDYPETDVRSVSWQSALAGRCAHKQGKFWNYHDLAFSRSDKLDLAAIRKIAEEVKLDMPLFDKCLKDNNIKNEVNDNIREADTLEINGIPFVFVNNQEFLGESSYADLAGMVERIIKK